MRRRRNRALSEGPEPPGDTSLGPKQSDRTSSVRWAYREAEWRLQFGEDAEANLEATTKREAGRWLQTSIIVSLRAERSRPVQGPLVYYSSSEWQKLQKGIITGCTTTVILFTLAVNTLVKSAENKSLCCFKAFMNNKLYFPQCMVIL